jgi:drug/metabolite transporter (DMT)-like permease
MHKGIKHILLATLCFSLVNIFAKLLSNPSLLDIGQQTYPIHELVFFRSLVSLLLCIAYLKRHNLPLFGNNKKWLLTRGIFGTLALTLFFYTLRELPLAIAVIVQYLSPLFTILFALYFLKEKISRVQWIFFTVAFGGIVFMSMQNAYSDGLQSISLFWILMGVFSALSAGIAYVAIIECKITDHPIGIVLYFPLIATPIMLIWCCFDFVLPHGIEWLFLLAMGGFTQLAQLLMTKALHEGGAVKITPFNYIGAIYAFFIGLFLFGEVLSWKIVLGMFFILIGVLGNAVYKLLKDSWNKHRIST